MSENRPIRNIAIIAHVDHGKTTLVDSMLRQSGIFRENEAVTERVMDSYALEKERGITILAKNTAIYYRGTKINIVDTPGHADFSGEVERVLNMVDGVLLIVDAFEGPMPQTKFVLQKALALALRPVVVINKIDRSDARAHEVLDEIIDLFIELNATDEQLDFPVIYASARKGTASDALDDEGQDIQPLFEAILAHIPPPGGNGDEHFQLQVTTLDYSEYVGRIAIGRIANGNVYTGQNIAIHQRDGNRIVSKVTNLYTYEGLKRIGVEQAYTGDIVAIAGLGPIQIGDTLTDQDSEAVLPVLTVDEPTLAMMFMVNDSPFSGEDGKYVTSRHLRDRLFRETEANISLRVEETGSPDSFKVSGRGELHLGILIETMRREGYEFQVSKPEVIMRWEGDTRLEPYERLVLDVPDTFLGAVMEKMGERKAEMTGMTHPGEGTVRVEFSITARNLIGFRSEFLTLTKGYGIMSHVFDGYGSEMAESKGRRSGVLIASEQGTATTFALHNIQERGILFITPGTRVYEGMVVGENSRTDDLEVNVSKKKHVTNMRASTAEEALRLDTPRIMSLEQYLEYVQEDELVEITPSSIRLRKKKLSKHDRSRDRKNKQMQ